MSKKHFIALADYIKTSDAHMSDGIRATRFPELGYRLDSPGNWRIVALETGSSVGPYYPTKAELLADLYRYAKEYGCEV